jgi:hypothetical protein
MSFHTITMFVRWAVSADQKTAELLNSLRDLPIATRKIDPRTLSIVQDLKSRWSRGTKIERLATLGWIEHDSIMLFCQMLDNLDSLRSQYDEQVRLNGAPPELRDEDVQAYERAIWTENKKIELKKEL